jgi:MOSC domain-containing protein YiiM
MPGTVTRLSVKPRVPGEYGLPKYPVDQLTVTPAGAEGDYNNYRTRELHGDPDQAILVITGEVLRQLNGEGWPVAPGDLGENLTLDGIAESALAPGARLRAGGVTLEVSLACDPCTELYSLPYVGKERGPGFVRTMKGRRGWYARVLEPGVVRVGDPVRLQLVPSA